MRAIVVAALCLAARVAFALDVAAPPYRARTAVEGVVRVWGNPETRPLLERWERAFLRAHPHVRFEHHLDGTDVGMAGLYTGQADLVLTGREATASEVKAFEWIYRYRPLGVEVATGSLDQPGRSPALVVYVHRDNPTRRLTLEQLDAAFSRERLRGAPGAATTWKDLGTGGEWSNRSRFVTRIGLEDGAISPVNAANANEILPPGVSQQKEIGVRNSYFRGLSISASYFDISRVNAVIDPVTNVFSNNGTINYKGLETVIAYELDRQWTLNAAGQWLKAVQHSADGKIDGLTPENTPKFIGNFFVTHRPSSVPGLSLTSTLR